MSATATLPAPSAPRPNAILLRRRREAAVGAVLLLAAAGLPWLVRDVYTQNLLILVLLYAGLAQAWNVLGGYCGQISLGHALYFGLGGYVSTLLLVRYGIPPVLGLWCGGVVAGLGALLVGWPCFRLSGHYYAVATVVVGELGLVLFLNWDAVGGAGGLYVPIAERSWLYLQFGTAKMPWHYLVLGYAALCWLAAYLIEGSRWGYAWRAVKDDVTAARSLAVRVFPSKMAAAAISGFLTGAGGAIYAQYVSYIDPESVMSGSLSILIALPAVLGGVGTLWGPLIGAAVLIPVSELSRSYIGGSGSGVDLMIYGGLIMAVALARPAGLVSLFGPRRPSRGRLG